MVRQEIKKFNMDCLGHSGLECEAPCTLYSVLFDKGIIADPSLISDTKELEGYSGHECSFTAEFEVTPLVLSMKSILLRFYGLDTVCRVELNGCELGTVDNMHRTYDFDVKTKVELGMNTLKLTFTPSVPGAELRKAYGAYASSDMPAIADMGIFRKVEIIAFNHKIISDVRVKQTHSEKSVRLDLSVSTVGYDNMSRAVATLTSPSGNVYFCGFIGGEGCITISDPNLWWPNGLGIQNLYKLNVNLYSDSELEDTYEMKIGLRTVAVNTDGDGVHLSVNGVPMLAMGGVYMSEDVLTPRLSRERTEALINDAKEANFNSIFIHGSGCYPESYLLDACDEHGLVVWAEIPVSDGAGDDTEAFAHSVKAELTDNLTRMIHHPSLAVIIGNERVERLLGSEEQIDEFVAGFSAYDGMNVFDAGGKLKSAFRFIGHDSLPTYGSVVRFTEPSERNLGSEKFELHGASHTAVMDMLSSAYGQYPYANGIEELSYVMGLASAEFSMAEVEAFRREKTKPLGVFMKRMNETWPSLSPSAVDYYGGKKPLHYYERRFFSPVRISVSQNGTRIKFIVSNDMRQDYVGVFAYALMNSKNQPLFRDSFPIRARASSNLEVHNVDFGSLLSGRERECYLLYSVVDKTNESSVGTYLFTKNKRFNFLKPNYTVEITGSGTEYIAAISADCFVKGVEVSFSAEKVSVDKNYFDITGRAPVRIHLTTPRMTTVEKLRRVIHIRSLYDLGHEE